MSPEDTFIIWGFYIFLGIIGLIFAAGLGIMIYEGWKKLKQMFKNKK